MELPVFETSLSGESDLIELNASNETFDSSQSTNWTRIDFVILFLKIITVLEEQLLGKTIVNLIKT